MRKQELSRKTVRRLMDQAYYDGLGCTWEGTYKKERDEKLNMIFKEKKQ